jgi:hypothetical protein
LPRFKKSRGRAGLESSFALVRCDLLGAPARHTGDDVKLAVMSPELRGEAGAGNKHPESQQGTGLKAQDQRSGWMEGEKRRGLGRTRLSQHRTQMWWSQ